MNKDISEIIGSLRLVLIIGLVFVHYGPLPHTGEEPFSGVYQPVNFLPAFLNSFLLFCFLSAVPILSIISGYLIGISKPTKHKILNIYNKRMKTVFVPWALWGCIWISVYWILFTIGKPYGVFGYYNIGFEQPLINLFLDGILGFKEEPFVIQFWFIHDLLLMIILLPILLFIAKNKHYFYIVAITIISLWLLEIEPLFFYNYKVMLYFLSGLFIGYNNYSLYKFKTPILISIPLYAILILIRVLTPMWNEGIMPFEVVFEFILRLVGAITMLSIAMHVLNSSPKIIKWLNDYSGYSFFIFAFHFPTIIILKNVFSFIPLTDSTVGQLGVWLLSIVFTIVLSVSAAIFISKCNQRVFLLLNGRRKIKC